MYPRRNSCAHVHVRRGYEEGKRCDNHDDGSYQVPFLRGTKTNQQVVAVRAAEEPNFCGMLQYTWEGYSQYVTAHKTRV